MMDLVRNAVRHMSGRHSFDYSRIEDGVFIGTNMCCQTGFDRELLSKGVSADISLEGERVDAPYGVDFFLWLPTEDHTPPSPGALEQGVQAISLLRRQGKNVYIHCKNGHGRAPTLFAACLMRRGMSVEEAIGTIKRMRPSIHLEPAQVEALRRFGLNAPH